MSFSTPKPLNNRLDFLKDAPKKNYSSYRASYNPESTPRYKRNIYERRKPLKASTSETSTNFLPTHSEARKNMKPVALNDRFQYLKTDSQKTPKKITFVSFPSRKQWEIGYRPAWILRSNADPPENYDVAYNIYKEYIEKDEINIPRTKFVGDKAKAISTSYLNKLNQKK